MKMSDLKPAYQFAQQNGCKMLMYGPPGTAKTPMAGYAPRPLLLACEAGLLSLKDPNNPAANIPTWRAYTAEQVDEFFAWFFGSAEAKNFDTLAIDSVSQMAATYLARAELKNKDGRAAYGVMGKDVYDKIIKLYYLPQKHIYAIAKECVEDVGEVKKYRPIFPGVYLNTELPHLFDVIAHAELHQSPSSATKIVGIRCKPSFNAMARDRSAQLAEIEFSTAPIVAGAPPPLPNLTEIFAKTMR